MRWNLRERERESKNWLTFWRLHRRITRHSVMEDLFAPCSLQLRTALRNFHGTITGLSFWHCTDHRQRDTFEGQGTPLRPPNFRENFGISRLSDWIHIIDDAVDQQSWRAPNYPIRCYQCASIVWPAHFVGGIGRRLQHKHHFGNTVPWVEITANVSTGYFPVENIQEQLPPGLRCNSAWRLQMPVESDTYIIFSSLSIWHFE